MKTVQKSYIGEYALRVKVYIKTSPGWLELLLTRPNFHGPSLFERLKFYCILLPCKQGPEVIKLFSVLNSTEHDFFLLINVKMPTFVGILTVMSGKNSILGLS